MLPKVPSLRDDILETDTSMSQPSVESSTHESFPFLHPKSSAQGPVYISSSSYYFSKKSQYIWKAAVVTVSLILMVTGRFNVPDNPVVNIEDKVLNAFQGLNNWIHDEKNAFYRSSMLLICGLQIDAIFFFTLIYWVLYGKTGRLPFSVGVFYLFRAIVQAMWWSPYPAGYYWDSPGFPSFVAPYGRGSDFFFSGHSGFLVLMANEWSKWGYRKVQNYIRINLVYTIFILIVYQAHYSIDIFTGVFFADYCFGKIDSKKEFIDDFAKRFASNVEGWYRNKNSKSETKCQLGAKRKQLHPRKKTQ